MAAAAFRVEEKQERYLSFSKPFMHSTLSILMSSSTSGPEEDFAVFFMEDLLNYTDLSLGVIKGSRAEKLLRKSQVPLYKKIWRKIRGSGRRRNENVVKTFTDGVEKVRSGDYALIVESTEAAYASLHPPCDLVALDQFMSITNYAFALPKDSSLVSDIDRALLQLQEQGVLQRLFHKWWNSGECLLTLEDPSPEGPRHNASSPPEPHELSSRDHDRINLPDIIHNAQPISQHNAQTTTLPPPTTTSATARGTTITGTPTTVAPPSTSTRYSPTTPSPPPPLISTPPTPSTTTPPTRPTTRMHQQLIIPDEIDPRYNIAVESNASNDEKDAIAVDDTGPDVEWFFVTHRPRPVEEEHQDSFSTRTWATNTDTGPALDIVDFKVRLETPVKESQEEVAEAEEDDRAVLTTSITTLGSVARTSLITSSAPYSLSDGVSAFKNSFSGLIVCVILILGFAICYR